MEANEIMLGDWVRRRWTCRDTGREVVKDFQVTEIRKNGETLYVWSKSGNAGRVAELEPIPLTPQILEKSGFGYREDSHGLTHFYPGSEFYCADISVHIGSDNSGRFWLNYRNNDIYGIRYVHELQHAFRLSGIEINIEL